MVGAATAYELGRGGARTLLVDRHDRGRATDAGAGILSPETAKRDDPSWTALVRAAGRYYDELVPRLRGDSGWARCGILQLATRETDVPAWEWVAEHAHGAREIAPAEASSMVPVLGPVVRALHHPDAARVDGRLLCAAVRSAAAECGVEVHEESVDDVRALDAEAIVIAGGAWTPRVADQLGVALPVGPMRGQIIHLDVDHDTATWPIVQPVFGYYLVPWADARVAVGATVEDAGFAVDVTAGGVHEVLRETLRVMPGLASARLREVRGIAAGERRRPAHPRRAAGAGERVRRNRPRRQRAAARAALGKLVADAVLGRAPELDLAPYSPSRFAT